MSSNNRTLLKVVVVFVAGLVAGALSMERVRGAGGKPRVTVDKDGWVTVADLPPGKEYLVLAIPKSFKRVTTRPSPGGVRIPKTHNAVVAEVGLVATCDDCDDCIPKIAMCVPMPNPIQPTPPPDPHRPFIAGSLPGPLR
jgi:hypothetical protein